MKTILVSTLLGCLLLAGCASAPVYRAASSPNDYGYRDTALTSSRFRVRFAGGYGVARETVENLALLRAAQVALAHGSQRFRVVSSDTDSITDYDQPRVSVGYGRGWGYWGSGVGISHSYAYARYETVLEIQIGADLPAKGEHIYNAKEVEQHLSVVAKGVSG